MRAIGSRGRRRGSSTRQVAVVNLDGLNDSSENEAPPPPMPDKMLKATPQKTEHITHSPDKMSRGIMSDSSDSDGESNHRTTIQTVAPRVPPHWKQSGSDDHSDDIFHLDYSVHNHHALMGAYKELHFTETDNDTARPSTPSHCPDDTDDECRILDSPATRVRRQKRPRTECPPSPTLFEMDSCIQLEGPQRSTRSSRAKNRTAQLLKNQRTSLPPPSEFNESLLNLSNDVLSEAEEDVNPEIGVLIKWGSEIFRLPIRKLQKFSHLYEALAEKYGVAASRIVLNFKDKIVKPELCPGDLNLTIADIIEGGAGSYRSDSRPSAPQPITQDADVISLRIQNNKKSSITISIGLKDKMGLLMHKYAEEKRLKLDKLRFMFDGEELSVNSTASSLDLEGEECIDVFELT